MRSNGSNFAQDESVTAVRAGHGLFNGSAALRALWSQAAYSLLGQKRYGGGTMKIIAAIEDPAVIAKILAHLGLPTRAPPRAPARAFAFFETA